MKKTMKQLISVIMVIVMAASLTGCGDSGEKGSTGNSTGGSTGKEEIVKIGFLTPLSGPNANYGQECLAAARMVVDLINNASPEYSMMLAKEAGLPNLGGAKIELVVGDSKSNPETAVSETKRMIAQEGVVAMTGQFTSAMTKTVAVVTEQMEIPLLTAGSSTSLTEPEAGLEWFFRYGPHDGTYIKDSFAYLQYLNQTKDAGIKTVALVSEDTEFGANIVKEEQKYAEEFGFEVVENIVYSANATNLSAEVMKLKTADPDVLFMASYTSDAILFISTFKEQNYNPKMILGQRGGFINTDFFSALGKDTEYIYTTAGWGADLDVDTSKQVLKLYEESYSDGVLLNEGHVKDMSNVLLLAIAINQAGSTDAMAVRDALKNLDVDTAQLFIPWEGITIDEYGQNTSASGFIQQVQNGEYATVYPENVKAVDAVYPNPAWNER